MPNRHRLRNRGKLTIFTAPNRHLSRGALISGHAYAWADRRDGHGLIPAVALCHVIGTNVSNVPLTNAVWTPAYARMRWHCSTYRRGL